MFSCAQNFQEYYLVVIDYTHVTDHFTCEPLLYKGIENITEFLFLNNEMCSYLFTIISLVVESRH